MVLSPINVESSKVVELPRPQVRPRIQVFSVANRRDILTRDLLRSPEIKSGKINVTVIWNALSASHAYSRAMDMATADIVVFVHQDVYFPDGWFHRMRAACDALTKRDPSWAVAGVCGITPEGEFVGHLWDSGLADVCGQPFDPPRQAISLDEVVLIVRRSSGVTFDEEMLSFHLYGTDIVLEARSRGKTAYVVDLPLIHNSKANVRLDHSYGDAYSYMVRKWRSYLPLPTVIVKLTRNPLPLFFRRLRLKYKTVMRASTLHPMLPNPEEKARELGFDR